MNLIQMAFKYLSKLNFQAVLDANLVVVRLLLIHGADPNLADADSWTPLHAAAANGHSNITRWANKSQMN